MAEHVLSVETRQIEPNPENPRLIFHQDELDALQESIRQQGILVPLTVYRDESIYKILDGERRWRCATKLGLPKVPVVVQPKPDRLTNIMMMFAIHHRRNEWDPLPTAWKLRDLEAIYTRKHAATPTEKQLAELASLTRGEVRRYKKLLSLPESYQLRLMQELQKPRSQQALTVDHVLEATAAATAVLKRGIIRSDEEGALRDSIVSKFETGVLVSTVDPRKFAKLARAVERGEVEKAEARKATLRFIRSTSATIREMFSDTVEQHDYQHGAEQLADRLGARLDEIIEREYELSDSLHLSLKSLDRKIKKIVGA
ncbi:ParB/RepB/Spo0J family partition protein [Luteimonas sp. BDR2-5]|uniref:ParB/RepB/Spo0J family partition protein n=1 Tax=Proluteimonas luteida TaxID=2878685 RepID=UPI001E5C5496|nr:ParB/RepB/Spo0J family partition protein [Luteimonas sp. BDR2-5]